MSPNVHGRCGRSCPTERIIVRQRSKTLRSTAAIIALALVGLTACGDDDASDAEPPATEASEPTVSATEPPTESDATAAAFPVTVSHTFGETTIEAEPQRVVSIGFTDHDTLLALGVEPVGIREWYGDYEYVWPWAEEALGDLEPTVIPAGDLNYEEIAALDPDLIVGLYIGLDEEQYETLSAIAPTVAQPADYPSFGAPWQVMTRLAGEATGRTDEAEAVIADVEGQFAALRDAHPDFEGVELAYAGVYGTDSANFYVETDGSTRMSVLQDLGFVVPDELAALGTDHFYHDISPEQLELLDQDVVLWEPAVLELMPAVEEHPIYEQLAVSIDDRDVFLVDPLIAGAMAHATALSLPTVLDFLVPELTRAVGNLDH